jgi:hypothetical protein
VGTPEVHHFRTLISLASAHPPYQSAGEDELRQRANTPLVLCAALNFNSDRRAASILAYRQTGPKIDIGQWDGIWNCLERVG